MAAELNSEPKLMITRSTPRISKDSTKRVFAAVLGVTRNNSYLLKNALLEAAEHSNDAEFRGFNGFGDVYVLRVPMQTEAGSAIVLSAWIILRGEDFPRLTTCYIV